jgi:hypothetical protein
MYTPGGVAVAIRGVGGRWGSRCGRFRCGPTVCCRCAVCCCCTAARCCAIATSATITAVLHHQSRCDGRLTAIGMLSAVTLPDRPHCRCTARSGAPTISGCHPRQDPPPVEPPPPKVQTNLSDQSVQPCFQFSPDASASRGVLSSVSTRSTNRPSVLPRSPAPALVCRQCRHRSAICSSFSTTRSARESRCMRCSAVFPSQLVPALGNLGVVAPANASRWTLAALMFAASYASRYASLNPLPRGCVTERLLLGCQPLAVDWRLWATGLWLAFVRLPPWS